jgi:hypothetical protein
MDDEKIAKVVSKLANKTSSTRTRESLNSSEKTGQFISTFPRLVREIKI